MKWKSRIKKHAENAVFFGLAVVVLVIVEYQDFIRKHNERR